MPRIRQQPLPPGSVIGILGGGQLGRMLALAAAKLGYRCHVFSPEADGPATLVTDRATIAAYDDGAALAAFAAAVDVITYEFENVPAAAAYAVARHAPIRPTPDVLAICQDRIREKKFLTAVGAPTCRYRSLRSADDLVKALAELHPPAVLKSARFGYDGKGQVAIDAGTDPATAWAEMQGSAGDATGILETRVAFTMEISVIVARADSGATAAFVPVQNIHEQHILKRTIAPAPIPAGLADDATVLAGRIAEAIDLVGVLAVEMFVTRDGRLLVNELAPRPHNSGHWTIDACFTSQFEQSVRAICGLPLGTPERHSDAVMENLLGDEVARWQDILAEPALHLHLYGKTEIRPGRKMGHVTRLTPRS
jgi:5-(carboxyamino)imidazole ribonucleotide synthase